MNDFIQFLKKSTLIILPWATLTLYHCDVKWEQARDQTPSVPSGGSASTTFAQVSATYPQPDCTTGPCATVSIQKPELNDNHRISQLIDDQLTTIVASFTRTGRARNLEKAMAQFFQDYGAFQEAFPESQTPWELAINMTADWIDPAHRYLSIRTSTYSYTGGVHPNTIIRFTNVTTRGKLLKPRDWLADKRALLQIAEAVFRKEKNIPATQRLSDAGYDFEGGRYQLPENIGFAGGRLILHYNPYEVSSYADGPITLSIPLDQLQGVVELD